MADQHRGIKGNEWNGLKQQLESLEAQREQLISLLGDDEESPLLQLQAELSVTIEALREKLSQTAQTATPEVGVGDIHLAPRVFDRRRARAVVEAIDPSKGTCTVSWKYPRQKGEIPCRFWKEGCCKFFGPDCTYSHGIEVSLGDLQPDTHGWLDQPIPTEEQTRDGERKDLAAEWLASLNNGSRVLARYEDRVWYEAIAQSSAIDGSLLVQFDGFEDDGPIPILAATSHLVPIEVARLATSAVIHDQIPETNKKSADSRTKDVDSDLEDAWADAPSYQPGRDGNGDGGGTFFNERVLGDRQMLPKTGSDIGNAGSLSDVYMFGDWEQHTKGFGSRMMTRMGYRRGEGLGKEKQGISRPVAIRVLPERLSLDFIRGDDVAKSRTSTSNRKSTGKMRQSSARRQEEDDAEPQKGMFDFLNVTIHAGKASEAGAPRSEGADVESRLSASGSIASRRPILDNAAASTPSSRTKGKQGARRSSAADMTRPQLRAHLVEAREAESALAAKIERLEQTVVRNAERDPRIAAQARQKLEDVRKQVREVRASQDRAEKALGDKTDRGKGGGKGGLFSF